MDSINAKKETVNIAYGAIFIALLIIFQYITSFFSNQLLTGICVNSILALSAFKTDLKTMFGIAVISPILAFLLGIGPKIPLFIPFLIISNCIFVYFIWLGFDYSQKRDKHSFVFIFLGICLGAILKSIFIFLSSIYILPLFLVLNKMQKMMLSSAFSFTACCSAILGGFLAFWLDKVKFQKKIKNI